MFQHRSNEFDLRVSAIARHLRALEEEIGGIRKNAGRHACSSAAAAGSQIVDALAPIFNEIVDRFRRSHRAIDEGANFGSKAVKVGVRAGNKTVERIATQPRQRPLVTLAVAIGLGILIGVASRRNYHAPKS